ncbi:MAG: Ldh family oxidoreductase [Bifidobacteriaceae bacterium]|jgi:LDH2 family malate/lactate/ureidoglycolate dehydrogenase|nr:Ldh family oxidoreductase [Bifidobacteriaceae bacterium]
MRVHEQQERELIERVLLKYGASPSAATIQANWLVEADLRSQNSHGIRRLPILAQRMGKGLIDPTTVGLGEWRTDSLLVVDGLRGFGPVVAANAIEAMLARVTSTGVAAAAIHNSNHVGVLALYVESIAKKGKVGIAATTSEALVHPWGGRTAVIGTNPLAIGVPATPNPLVADIATGVVSMGLVLHRAEAGVALEPGWALDSAGRPTVDPKAAADGAISPFGAHKGYALGLALEVMVATLTGSALGRAVRGTLDADDVCNKGDLFLCIDPEATGTADTLDAVSEYLHTVKAVAPQSGSDGVQLPGEPEQHQRAARLADGYEIPDLVWEAASHLLDDGQGASAVHSLDIGTKGPTMVPPRE